MIKKILLSLGISIVLLVGCLVVGTVIVLVASAGQKDFNVPAVHVADLPFRPMKALYYWISPPTSEDYKQTITMKKLAVIPVVYGGSVLLYAIPIFGILVLVSKIRPRKENSELIDSPPQPPSIDDV
ncbi:MAG TPA: hypothetical protein VGO43_03400 [Pyrinomonadaceae bacterium]|jgi:hypothetical protein|nr:hypothetical protein [Pyrinomonadaceae bacterium]